MLQAQQPASAIVPANLWLRAYDTTIPVGAGVARLVAAVKSYSK